MNARLFLVFVFLLECVVPAQSGYSVAEIISFVEHNYITPEMVNPAIREEVVAQLRAKLRADNINIPENVSGSLILLGDDQTIAKVMEKRREAILKVGKSQSIGGDFGPSHPLLIPYLAEDFFPRRWRSMDNELE
jgi:hypothetical protein